MNKSTMKNNLNLDLNKELFTHKLIKLQYNSLKLKLSIPPTKKISSTSYQPKVFKLKLYNNVNIHFKFNLNKNENKSSKKIKSSN